MPWWRRVLRPVTSLAVIGAAVWLVARVLSEHRLADISQALGEVPVWSLGAGLGMTILGYLALVGYDYLAFQFARRPLPWRRMLVPSFVSFAVANSAPVSVLAAGGIRYRMYKDVGLTPVRAAVVAGFNVVTYAVGLCTLAGLVLVAHPMGIGRRWLGLSGRILGILLVLLALGYLLSTRLHSKPFSILGRRLRLPSPGLALEQLGVSVLDWLLSAGALYVLLIGVAPVPVLSFLGAFFIAQATALLLPVPGGLGVFEAVVLLLRPEGVPAPRVLAALMLYRVIYYLLPLLVAGALIVVKETRHVSQR